MFVYTSPYTGFDVSFGQTFKQNAVRPESDGTFTILKRTIVVGGGVGNERVPEFSVTLRNVSREDARKFAADWLAHGFSLKDTEEFGLTDIDAEIARKAERRARRGR